MAVLNNAGFGPAPITAPISSEAGEFGLPFDQRTGRPPASHGVSSAWAAWFNSLRAFILAPRAVIVRTTQAGLAAIAADLGAQDTGYLVAVTDYGHLLMWDGSDWEWGPGESGSGFIQGFMVDPTGPGWKLCDGKGDDGSAIGVGHPVSYLKSDGTLGTITSASVAPCLPDLVSAGADAAYPKLGSPASGVNPAVGPTFSGGTISTDATGVTAAAGNDNDAGVNVTTGAGNNVALRPHQHAITITDPHHTHTLSGGSIGADGEPQNIVLRPWFRK